MLAVEQLRALASYYREIIASLSSQSGRHLIDLGANFRYGFTVDLNPYIPQPSQVVEQEAISFRVERISPEAVSEVVAAASHSEDVSEGANAEASPDVARIEKQTEKSALTARLIAIYRKQQQDPFNRETILGYPVVAGRYGSVKFCAPLLYFSVSVQFDPVKSTYSIAKQFEAPTLNSHLLVKLTGSEDEATTVRRELLPLLHQAEFDRDTLEKIIRVLAELAPGFKGLRKDPRSAAPLLDALEARNNSGSILFKTAVLVNAKRTGAFLQDDLTELGKLKELTDETVVDTLLADLPEGIDEPSDSEEASNTLSPLLFPLQSNKAQRITARKAERAKLLVVQGPPGTGKSQTITNLVCHLTATGHSVLVTSHQNKALEVITQMLPQIDYMAMSLLKGEKESVSRLANQLERFSATVATRTVTELESSHSRALQKLVENEDRIRRLIVRFKELKHLERDRSAPYQRYHDIREFDCINRDDQIPIGSDQVLIESLIQWRALLYSVLPQLGDLIKTFGDFGTASETAPDSSKALGDLIGVFRDAANLIANSQVSLNFVREIAKEETLSAGDRKYLQDWSNWLGETRENIFANVNSLRTFNAEPVSLEEILRLARFLGSKAIHGIVEEAEKCADNTSLLLQESPPSKDLPTSPTEAVLVSARNAINELSARSGSWFSWQLSPTARAARKTMVSLDLGNATYGQRRDYLEKRGEWLRVWNLRTSIVVCLKKLRDVGVPLADPDANSSALLLRKDANIGLAFVRLLRDLGASPQGPTSRAHREIIERFVCALDADARADLVINSLDETEKHLARMDIFARIVNSPFFERASELPARYLRNVLRSVILGDNVCSELSRWESVLRAASSYGAILALEADALKGLARTLRAARKQFAAGIKVNWLEHPELAVAAHRLSTFIREDQVKNPDDINDIARKISETSKLRQSLVEDVIRRARLVSLKKADQDNATKFQIVKLRQLLKKKTKTPSLVQLRDQIEYKRLLKVFPCWIMSIEDVARLFPLQAGLFDYLIVDEASQCNQATTLHLAYRAKKMAVVGDRQQLKNANVRFLGDSLVRMLLSKHGLDKHPRADFLHGRESLLALSEAGANSTSFLNEHFRCEPPIIAWSNGNFYEHQLRILTPIRPRRFVPVAEVHLVPGADDNPELKVNRVEAEALIAEVKRLINSGEASGLDIGIISPYEAQATLLNNLLHETFSNSPQVLHEHRLTASTADGFQGDERDIVLYSFRYGPSSSPGVVRAIELERERLNVAFSRARRKVVSFISQPVEAFPSGLIKSFLVHSLEIQQQSESRLPLEVTDKFDSEFEKRVCESLRNRGLTVLTQVPCAGFFIDLIVLDSEGRRLAVECDGEFHYDDDNDLRPEDYQRQDIIERSGWVVFRISTRRFYSNPGASTDAILEELKAQPTESDLVGGDVSLDFDEQEEIPVGAEGLSSVSNSVSSGDSGSEKTSSAIPDRDAPSTGTAVAHGTLGDGPIGIAENWVKLSRWGWISRKLNRYITWYSSDIGKRLSTGEKLSEQKVMRAREIWDMAHKLGFDETRE